MQSYILREVVSGAHTHDNADIWHEMMVILGVEL